MVMRHATILTSRLYFLNLASQVILCGALMIYIYRVHRHEQLYCWVLSNPVYQVSNIRAPNTNHPTQKAQLRQRRTLS